MNTDRLYYGDIYKIEHIVKKYDYELFEGEDVFATIPMEETCIRVNPYKRKAVLVKYDNGFVELTKLKTLKDFINVFLELGLEFSNRRYVLKEYDFENSYFLTPDSIKKCEKLDKQHYSIKKLQKIYEEKK